MKRRVCKHCAKEYEVELGCHSGLCSIPCRFWHKVLKSSDADGCWEWTAVKVGNGYGQIGINGKMHYTHRYSYELHHGPIPPGEGPHGTCVLHRCDNPGCVNPEHLFLGSNADNVRDRETKGRGNQPKGEDNGQSALTRVQVDQIREAYGKGGVTQVHLGQEYGVVQAQISKIINRKYWK